MRSLNNVVIVGLMLGGLAGSASAAVLYTQDFEAAALGTASANGGYYSPGTFGNLQAQGGCGAGTVTGVAGIDANGVGGSHGYTDTADNSAASQYTYGQITGYGVIGAPGAGTTAAAVQVKASIYISGSETSTTPLTINIIQGANTFSFTPTLANGVYTPVTFTLNQATVTPGTGVYDPTVNSNFQIAFGAGGFGFDANNVVRLDNLLVQTIAVPEPTTLAAVAGGALALLRRRRSI